MGRRSRLSGNALAGRQRMGQRTIYVALLDEGTEVWRPVAAEELHNGVFRIVAERPDLNDERWQFPPGAVVCCEQRELSGGPALVAVKRATV
jgi:hypothetical protein